MKAEKFETWEAAFDSCREGDAPMVVEVKGEGEITKIYPSGSCKTVCRLRSEEGDS